MNNYYPQNTQYGYGYTAPRPQARNTQPLTQEQILALRTDGKKFDMKIDQEDLWRSSCTHKEKNGASTLIQNPDGSYTCSICQATFNMVDLTPEEVEKRVKDLEDVLQTIKTIYVDAPDKLIEQYMQMIALLAKLKELWNRSIQNFSMYEGTTVGGVNQMGPGYSGFGALQSMLSNPYGGFGAYGQQYPQYPQPTMAPQYYNNGGYGGYPMPAQQMGQPMMDPNANPMAYGAPQQMPMAPAVGTIPNAPQPQQAAPTQAPVPAPAQPQQAEVQQTQVFNV